MDLGSLTVEVEGSTIELGTTKQAALLCVLAARANQRVPATDLVAAAWGLDVEVSMSSLDSQLWRLRNILEPHRGRTSSVLVRDGGGYRLVAAPDAVDSLRFERLGDRANAQVRDGDPAAALIAIEEALELWRGEPFEAVIADVGTVVQLARLIELRQQLEELRIDALIGQGLPHRAIVDLEEMIGRNPLRERLWAQRMTALVQLDRTDEALAAYARLTQLLADELGLDPGPDLRALHGRILARDPSLVGAARPAQQTRQPREADDPVAARIEGEARTADPVAVRLPRRATPLIGRAADTDRVAGLVLGQPLVTICGSGGSGKTRLAIEVAARVAADFPDGVWFVDLTATTEPDLVIDIVVSTLALSASQVFDPIQVLREFARGRRILLVLDNCEHVLDGVALLVEETLLSDDAERGAAVLATSREPIGVDGEYLWSIAPLSLAGPAPAVELFTERARASDPELVLDADAMASVVQICRALDGIPLAIELAAARVRSFSLTEIAEQVRADPTRLSRVGRQRGDHRQSLYEAMEWSYRLLTEQEQSLHRCLSVLPGPFPATAAAGVAPPDLNAYEVTELLLGLAHRSLLDVRPGQRGTGTVFAQLDTVRAHGRRHLVEAGEEDLVLARRDDWVAALLARRPRLGRPEAPLWYDELEESYPVVRAVLQRAVGPAGSAELIGLGSGLGFFWLFRSRMIEGARWLEAAQASGLQRAGSVEELLTLLRLGAGYLLRFRPDLGRPQLDAALPRVAEVPASARVVVAEALVSAAGGAWAGTAYDLLPALSRALDQIAAGTDDQVTQLFAEIIACITVLPLGRLDEARETAERLYRRSVELDNLVGAWFTSLAACVVESESLRPADALGWARRVIGLHERLGTGGSKSFLETVGNGFALSADHERAVRVYAATCAHARQAGVDWPEHPKTRELFERARAAMDPAAFDRAWAAGERMSLRDIADWAEPDRGDRFSSRTTG
ncbi:AfsR/SARP family transcriptional regulator [Microlunatus ginsengisoli]